MRALPRHSLIARVGCVRAAAGVHAMPCRAVQRCVRCILCCFHNWIRSDGEGLPGRPSVRLTAQRMRSLHRREADRPGAGLPVHGVRRLMVMLRVVLALVVRQLCAAAHVVCRVCGACRTSPAVAHRSPSQLV